MQKLMCLLAVGFAAALLSHRSEAAVGQTYDLRADFGAKCDGKSDDTAAIQAWLGALGPQTRAVAPPGDCRFRVPLVIDAESYALSGSGPYATVFRYVGKATDVDLLTIKHGDGEVRNISLSNFKIVSDTMMTGGAAIHFRKLVRSTISDVVAGGQDSNGYLWDGFWFDQVDSVYMSQFEARGRADCVRVNGSLGGGPKADLGLIQAKIGGCRIGIHVAGGFGGLYVDQADVIGNDRNLLIDNSAVREGNREIFLGSTSTLDTSKDDSIFVDDPLANDGTLDVAGWVASGGGSGVHIKSWNGKLNLRGSELFNFKGDGARIDDSRTYVRISGGLAIRGNQGFGINATVPTKRIYSAAKPFENARGSYSANCSVEAVGSARPTAE